MGVVYDFVTFATGLRGVPGIPFGQFFAVWAAVIEGGVILARADCDAGDALCVWAEQSHDDIERIKDYRSTIEWGLSFIGLSVPPMVWGVLDKLQDGIDEGTSACRAATTTTRPTVETGTLTSQETNCFRALIGASFSAVETSADVFALTEQMKQVAPCSVFVGPLGTEEQYRVLAEQGNAQALAFFKAPAGLSLLVGKWKKALVKLVGSSEKARLFSTKQQVSDAWRAALAGKKLDESVLSNTLGLLPLDPSNRKVVVAGAGLPTWLKVVGGVVVVGGVGGVVYAVATSKKRKAA